MRGRGALARVWVGAVALAGCGLSVVGAAPEDVGALPDASSIDGGPTREPDATDEPDAGRIEPDADRPPLLDAGTDATTGPKPDAGLHPACTVGIGPGMCPGSCDAGTCVIECSNGASGCDMAHCPPGMPCRVSCTGSNACGQVDCGDATACDVTCSGTKACGSAVKCSTEGTCDVSCADSSSCSDLFCSKLKAGVASRACTFTCTTASCGATVHCCPSAGATIPLCIEHGAFSSVDTTCPP